MSQLTNTTAFLKNFDETLKDVLAQSPEWLRALRRESARRFQEAGLPTVKDEEWKYTSLTALTQQPFVPASLADISEETLKVYADDAIRLVFVNGNYNQKLSRLPKNLIGTLMIMPLEKAAAENDDKLKIIFSSFDVSHETRLSFLNNALWQQGIYIEVPAKTKLENPVHIVHVAANSKERFYVCPRTVIYLNSLSEASVLESHVSLGEEGVYLSNGVTDVYLADGAVLNYYKAQKESRLAFHINHIKAWCQHNARFNGFTFTTSTGLTRNDLFAVLNGEGSDATLRALHSNYGSQHVDNHTCVEHRVPNCTSNQLYKGILNDAARAVFNGKIIVRAIAQQTNSYQLNKTLMLGPDARIDTKPQLEIFADDVKCTHGATIGHMDDDQMFYLQSRSISKADATKILARGFADDVLGTIENQSIQDKFHLLLEPSLQAIRA